MPIGFEYFPYDTSSHFEKKCDVPKLPIRDNGRFRKKSERFSVGPNDKSSEAQRQRRLNRKQRKANTMSAQGLQESANAAGENQSARIHDESGNRS